MLTLRRFLANHLPDPIRSAVRRLHHALRRWQVRRVRAPVESYDLVLITPPESDGWILHAICAEIGARFHGRWTIVQSQPPFPKARVYFFAHYWTYLRHRHDSPHFKSADLLVWFTHPSQVPYSDREIIRALNESTKVVFSCDQFARMMIAKGLREDRAAVVLGAADPRLFRAHTRTGQGRVGFVSAFYERKSPDTILEIVRRMPHRRFLLIGRNWRSYRRFDELAECPNFTYRELPYADYPGAYAEMDVLVSPSLVEGGPIPLVEAMMSNVVPVASSTGFAPDLITDGENGFLFPPGASADVICPLIEKAFALKSDVRATVERYSWDRFANEVLKLLPALEEAGEADEDRQPDDRGERSTPTIAWYMPKLNPRVASMRYRCFLPALHLGACGFESRFISRDNLHEVRGADYLVVVKYFDPWSLAAAHMAHDAGIPVILDQCENIWDRTYRGAAGATWRKYFDALAAIADVVVTPSPFLAAVVRRNTARDVPVTVISDPVEAASDWQGVLDLLRVADSRRPAGYPERAAAPRIGRWSRRALRVLSSRIGGAHPSFGQRRPPGAPSQTGLPGKRLLWFGNHGSDHAEGMLALLRIAPVLERICREVPLHLVVASNNRDKYLRYIDPLPIPTAYVDWDPVGIHDLIRSADLCILPNPTDDLTRAKSSNRATLALSHGTPVVATMLPALEPLSGCIVADDWEHGIRRYLTDPQLVETHLGCAAAILETEYSGPAIAVQWADMLRPLGGTSRPARGPVAAPGRVRLLLVMTLVQDLDLLQPVILAAQARSDLTLTVAVPRALLKDSPRTYRALLAAGIIPRVVTEKEILAGALWVSQTFDALLTAAESDLPGHKLGRALAEQGNARGVRTYTVQHGYENAGLTYFDDLHDEAVSFASSTIFTWQDLRELAVSPPATTLARSVPVGCPKGGAPEERPLPVGPAAGPTAVIFENLHWHRYGRRYRDRFLSDLRDAARALPDWRFLVKPHHAGSGFTNGRLRKADLENLLIANPADPVWEPFTAPALIAHAEAVISTPSTAVLDAARAGKPVAVTGYGLDLPLYEPLPILTSCEDWLRFLNAPDPANLLDRARRFVKRAILPGDGAVGILDRIIADAAADRRDAAG